MRKQHCFTLTLIVVAFSSFCVGAAAEESPSDRVSIVDNPANESARAEAIRLALRELGYTEGQNITIEYRYGEGKPHRIPELAAELVRLKVDIIVVLEGIYRSGRPKMGPRRFPSLWRAKGPILSRGA